MARDVFDPGPRGDYPYFPRDAQGRPLWSDSAETDGEMVDGQVRQPRGVRRNWWNGQCPIDLTPTGPGGVPIDPPVIPPGS